MYNQNFYYPPISPLRYASGGNVASHQNHGLAAAAEQLRRRGREGDTILAHISPQEAGILKLLGGSGTINPHTGLPEYKKFWKNITAKNIAAPVAAAIATYVAGPEAGAAAYAATKKAQGASDEEALKGAALTYVGANIASGAGAGASGGGGGTLSGGIDLGGIGYDPYATVGDYAASNAGSAAGSAAGSVVDPGIIPPPTTPATAPTTVTSIPPAAPSGIVSGGIDLGSDYYAGTTAPPAQTGIVSGGIDLGSDYYAGTDATAAGTAGTAASSTVGDYLANLGNKALQSAVNDPLKAALYGTMAYSGVTAAQETKKQREAAEREIARQEATRQENIRRAETIMASNPTRYRRLTAADVRRYGIGMPTGYVPPAVQAAKGGIMNAFDDENGTDDNAVIPRSVQGGYLHFDRGGIASLPPRYLSGGGDGMSDSIPARIGAKQEARLADGEFVIPADVVSHIGNGSSNAGAKKLYAMMDRIRQARTGKTKQAPAIKTNRLMPA